MEIYQLLLHFKIVNLAECFFNFKNIWYVFFFCERIITTNFNEFILLYIDIFFFCWEWIRNVTSAWKYGLILKFVKRNYVIEFKPWVCDAKFEIDVQSLFHISLFGNFAAIIITLRYPKIRIASPMSNPLIYCTWSWNKFSIISKYGDLFLFIFIASSYVYHDCLII